MTAQHTPLFVAVDIGNDIWAVKSNDDKYRTIARASEKDSKFIATAMSEYYPNLAEIDMLKERNVDLTNNSVRLIERIETLCLELSRVCGMYERSSGLPRPSSAWRALNLPEANTELPATDSNGEQE